MGLLDGPILKFSVFLSDDFQFSYFLLLGRLKVALKINFLSNFLSKESPNNSKLLLESSFSKRFFDFGGFPPRFLPFILQTFSKI